MGSNFFSAYVLKPVTFDDYPIGVSKLAEDDAYPRYLENIFRHSCIVVGEKVYPTREFYFGNLPKVASNEEIKVSISLLKGYDDIDYDGPLYTVSSPGKTFWIKLTKPGCYVLEVYINNNLVIGKRVLQAGRIDLPFDPGTPTDDGASIFEKKIKSGDGVPLLALTIGFFVNSSNYLWDSVYEFPKLVMVDGAVSRMTGPVVIDNRTGTYKNTAKVGFKDNHGSFSFNYTYGKEIRLVSDDPTDAAYSILSKTDVIVYYSSNPSIYSFTQEQITEYTIGGPVISHIQRVGGSQLFCYLEDGTVIPFQRSGKNLYGYGSMQLSGIDYGSYMEVSVDGGDTVVMDYWQKRGIYVPRGGDNG